MVQYTYTAAGDAITFTPRVAGDSFHHYAFSNEVAGVVPEPGAVAGVLMLGALALRRRKR